MDVILPLQMCLLTSYIYHLIGNYSPVLFMAARLLGLGRLLLFSHY